MVMFYSVIIEMNHRGTIMSIDEFRSEPYDKISLNSFFSDSCESIENPLAEILPNTNSSLENNEVMANSRRRAIDSKASQLLVTYSSNCFFLYVLTIILTRFN